MHLELIPAILHKLLELIQPVLNAVLLELPQALGPAARVATDSRLKRPADLLLLGLRRVCHSNHSLPPQFKRLILRFLPPLAARQYVYTFAAHAQKQAAQQTIFHAITTATKKCKRLHFAALRQDLCF